MKEFNGGVCTHEITGSAPVIEIHDWENLIRVPVDEIPDLVKRLIEVYGEAIKQ